jgi:uncharacterized integral membrane protein
MTQKPQQSAAAGTRFRLNAKWITALVLIAIGLTFVVQNRDLVQILLFVPTITAPLWAALIAMLVLGLLIGFLLGRQRHR